MLFSAVTMHWRVTGISMLGVPDEMATEMVTTAGSEGAMKRAFNPGGAEMIPPLFASQLITALGGIKPSSASGICSVISILQSFGRIVTAFVCVATVPQAAVTVRDTETAIIRMTLRDILPLAFTAR